MVDWFHVIQHLVDAVSALDLDENDSKNWMQRLKLTKIISIWDGAYSQNHRALRQSGWVDLPGYFEQHQQGKQYLEIREESSPIGSRTTERGDKQFKQ